MTRKSQAIADVGDRRPEGKVGCNSFRDPRRPASKRPKPATKSTEFHRGRYDAEEMAALRSAWKFLE